MKDYVGENERILDEWCAKFVEDKKSDEAYKGYNASDYFAPDGIMNKGEFYINNDDECRRNPCGKENQLWAETPLRILFLSKDQNAYGGEAKDVRTETFHLKGINIPIDDYQISGSLFYQNEACLLYSLLHSQMNSDVTKISDYSWEDSVRFSDEQIFARINCKKEIGESTCPNWLLQNAIDNYSVYLKNQIINLDADILICSGYNKQIVGTHNIMLNFLNTIGYNFKQVSECSEEVYFDSDKNKIALNIYHLSYFRYNFIKTIEAYHKFLQTHPDFIKSHRV